VEFKIAALRENLYSGKIFRQYSYYHIKQYHHTRISGSRKWLPGEGSLTLQLKETRDLTLKREAFSPPNETRDLTLQRKAFLPQKEARDLTLPIWAIYKLFKGSLTLQLKETRDLTLKKESFFSSKRN
jgi:hypothetical protein